jgi:phosphate transport system substrate-binding protein
MKQKIALLSLIAFFAFCGNAFAQKITLEGSTTLLSVAQSAAEEYADKNTSVDIIIRGGGSGVGITSLLDSNCDIANSSREIKEAELARAKSLNKQLKIFAIAKDGITIIVNKNNPVSNLTKQQLADIYSGKITNWKEVGGKDEKIVIVSRDSASGTFETFAELVLKGQKTARTALMQSSNQSIVLLISKTPSAIGYVGIGFAGGRIKAITIDNIASTPATIKSGAYPLSRALYMITLANAQPDIKKFIDFVLSAEGQGIVERQGFVSIR